MQWRSAPNLAVPNQIRPIIQRPLPPFNSAVSLPGQVETDPRDVLAPNPGAAGPIRHAPAPNPGAVRPIRQIAPAQNQGVAGPNPANAPAPNPHGADQIPQNAPAQNQNEAAQPNASSKLSIAWGYFKSNWTAFLLPIPRRIALKMVFRPPSPSYSIGVVNGRDTFQLPQSGPNQLTPEQLSRIEVFQPQTSNGNTIVCIFIPFQNPKYTLFISHGHDVDIGQRCFFYHQLGRRLRCNVFAYDYSGYGRSGGRASEANMYADAEAALGVLTDINDITVRQIVFYGHSLGTAAAIHLTSQEQQQSAGGLILIAPFKSGLRVFFPNMPFNSRFDWFPNIDKIEKVWCTTLFIEPSLGVLLGSNAGHAGALHARLPRANLEVTSIEGRHYDNVEESDPCLARLDEFIAREAGHQPPPARGVINY